MSGFGSDGWYESLLKLLPLLLLSAAAADADADASPSVDVGIFSGWKKVEKDEQPKPMMGTEVGSRPCRLVLVLVLAVAFFRPPNGRRGHLDGPDEDSEEGESVAFPGGGEDSALMLLRYYVFMLLMAKKVGMKPMSEASSTFNVPP